MTNANNDDLVKIKQLENEKKELQFRLQQVEKEQIEYLQNVSHQLVAPLNAIKWHIENLTANRVGYDRAIVILRSIYSQATLAVHLAKNFNLMSNLDADHTLTSLKEPLQDVNLFKTMINLANDFQPIAADKKINIIVNELYFEEAPKAFVIRPLIAQVFSNIIENAVKYSHNNSEISIQGKYTKENDQFQIIIKNKGISLKDEEVEKIFERGFRSIDAKRKYPAGTGFGLYIAKKIVEIHKGQIKAHTKNGFTIFEIVLPVQLLRKGM